MHFLGVWSPNSYESVVAMFAASKAGAILVSLNPKYNVNELLHEQGPNEGHYCRGGV